MTENNDIAALTNLYDGTEMFLVPEPALKTWRNTDTNALKAVIVCKALSENDRELLGKILGALSVTENEVLIVDAAGEGANNFSDIKRQTGVNKYIVFGMLPLEIGLNIKPLMYQPVNMLGVSILFADGLPELAKDPQKKKALWLALKDIFAING